MFFIADYIHNHGELRLLSHLGFPRLEGSDLLLLFQTNWFVEGLSVTRAALSLIQNPKQLLRKKKFHPNLQTLTNWARISNNYISQGRLLDPTQEQSIHKSINWYTTLPYHKNINFTYLFSFFPLVKHAPHYPF